MASKEDSSSSLREDTEDNFRYRSRASSVSAKSDKFAMPSTDPERMTETPVDLDDDRMSVASSTAKSSSRNASQKLSEGFQKECSYDPNEASPSHSEKLDLAMIPVISDQLLLSIVNKERSIEQIDVYLFVKKSLDLLMPRTLPRQKWSI
uniref:Uncharacterized protein n=1 Tax=Ditylenchus dipsaci TaxID=166011 RepID=A0A915D928_9BILA